MLLFRQNIQFRGFRTLNTDLGGRYTIENSGSNSSRKLKFSGEFSAIVSVSGYDIGTRAIFSVIGYGVTDGITDRVHVTEIFLGRSIECNVVEGEEAVCIRNRTAPCHISVFMLYGTLPAFII